MSAPTVPPALTLPDPPLASDREMILVAATVVVPALVFQFVRSVKGVTTNPLHFSDARLWITVAIEIVIACIWLPRLRRHGWTLQRVSRSYEWWDVPRGVALVCGTYIAAWIASVVVYLAWLPLAVRISAIHPDGSVSWIAVLSVALLNPVFEESLYLGYLANALRRSSWAAALWVSVGVRVALHLYQGPLAFVYILPLGILFSLYYLKTGRLWPVVFAHIVLDLLPLASLAHGLV